jgi:hypothetical protein
MSIEAVQPVVRRSNSRRRRRSLTRWFFFRKRADVLRFTAKVPFSWEIDDLDNRDHPGQDGTFLTPRGYSGLPVTKSVNSRGKRLAALTRV